MDGVGPHTQAMRVDVPAEALVHGFVNEPVGTHTSRTLMFRELGAVMTATEESADSRALRDAAVNRNAVEKSSAAGRVKTFRHLRELYGMNPGLNVFLGLRRAWTGDASERPLIAALCALARDPIFRATASVVLAMGEGEEFDKKILAKEVAEDFPGHYSEGVTSRIARNVASSWTQSGHFVGRVNKRRIRANAGPVALAYALYLGHLTGLSGRRLFDTVWTSILDRPPSELESLAQRASRQGWIDYRASGGMVEVTFRHLDAAAEG